MQPTPDQRHPTAAPSLDELLGVVRENGWENYLDTPAGRNAIAEDLGEDVVFLEACAEVANSEAGRIMLDGILEMTLRAPTWPGGLGLGRDKLADFGLFREGQNSIAAILLLSIRRHEEIQATGDGDDGED